MRVLYLIAIFLVASLISFFTLEPFAGDGLLAVVIGNTIQVGIATMLVGTLPGLLPVER